MTVISGTRQRSWTYRSARVERFRIRIVAQKARGDLHGRILLHAAEHAEVLEVGEVRLVVLTEAYRTHDRRRVQA